MHNDCIGNVWELGSVGDFGVWTPQTKTRLTFPDSFRWRHDQFTHLGRVGRCDRTWLKTSCPKQCTHVGTDMKRPLNLFWSLVDLCGGMHILYIFELAIQNISWYNRFNHIYMYSTYCIFFVMYEYDVSFKVAIVNFKRSLLFPSSSHWPLAGKAGQLVAVVFNWAGIRFTGPDTHRVGDVVEKEWKREKNGETSWHIWFIWCNSNLNRVWFSLRLEEIEKLLTSCFSLASIMNLTWGEPGHRMMRPKGSTHIHWYLWMFPKIVVPQNGWFIMENPIKMDDLGLYHYFRKQPYIGTIISAFIGVHHFKPWKPVTSPLLTCRKYHSFRNSRSLRRSSLLPN